MAEHNNYKITGCVAAENMTLKKKFEITETEIIIYDFKPLAEFQKFVIWQKVSTCKMYLTLFVLKIFDRKLQSVSVINS